MADDPVRLHDDDRAMPSGSDADLPNPDAFEGASQFVTPEQVAETQRELLPALRSL
jgi:hypothetical protein